MKIRLLTLLIFVWLTSIVFADDNTEMVLVREVLKEVIQRRQKPLLFEVKYRVVTQRIDSGTLPKDSLLNDGRVVETEEMSGTRIESVGLMRIDEIAERLYFDESSTLLDVLDDGQKDAEESNLRKQFPARATVVIDGRKLTFYPATNQFVEGKPNENVDQESPIDFRLFGWTLPTGLRRFPSESQNVKSFSEIAQRLVLDFGKMECPIDKDGIVLIDLNNEYYKVDTKRGYWPIAREGVYWEKNKDGERVKRIPVYSTKVELVEFGEQWLQKRVEVLGNSFSRSYEFEWISCDTPLAKVAFDLDKTVHERFGKKKPGDSK